MLTSTITLTKKQLQYFAEARYDMVFGTSYQHTRTFSFPFRFEEFSVDAVTLTETEVYAKTNTPSDPQILIFLIACHQFWLYPGLVKDGYVLEVQNKLPDKLLAFQDDITIAYKEGGYYVEATPISFTHVFHPPYTKGTQHNVFDKDALFHAVMGLPSKGFGDKLQKFDKGRFVPRLPAGDLLCIDHIEEVEPNYCRSTYQPPQVCSFALILEAALQPCGWLSHHMGCLDSFDDDTYFRNLNGELTLHAPYQTDQSIVFDVKLLRTAKLGGKMIVNFAVEGYQNNQHMLTMQTAFGYFSKQSLEKQGGFAEALPKHPYLPRAIPTVLKANRQFMVEEILYADDKMIHCRRMLSPDDWYFKAHFFQDPVQPGSLGIQAFYDAIGLWAKKTVVPIGTCIWKYRGQTLPFHSVLDVTVTVQEVMQDRIMFRGKLWVDGTCIYDLEQASIMF